MIELENQREKQAIQTMGDEQGPSVLPAMKNLAVPPLIINGVLCAAYALIKNGHYAVGIIGGCLVGLLMYALLHTFVGKVFSILLATPGQQKKADPLGMAYFGVFAIGKFVLVALTMFLFLAVLRASVMTFVVGFLVTQVSITASVFKTLLKKKAAG